MKNLKASYVLYAVALGFTALNLFLQVLPINTSNYFEQHLGLSAGEIINLNSIFFIFYALMQIPGGIIFDKFGLKIILPLALFLTLSGSILYMVCNNAFMLAISRGLTGLGSSIAYIIGIYIAFKCFSQEKLSFFIALVEASATVGALIAAKVFYHIMQHFGWNIANLMIISFTTLLLILSLIFVRGFENPTDTQALNPRLMLRQVIGLFKNKVLILLFLYSCFTWAIIMSFAGYWLKNYMIYMHHYSESTSLTLVEIYWASFLFAGLIIGFLSKNIKQCRVVLTILAVLGCVNYLVMAIPILFSHTELIIVAFLGGVSASGVILAFTIITDVVDPELSGTAIAVNNTFIVVGGLAGQVLFGFIVENNPLVTFSQHSSINAHYYSALLIYPLFSFIAMIAVIAALKRAD